MINPPFKAGITQSYSPSATSSLTRVTANIVPTVASKPNVTQMMTIIFFIMYSSLHFSYYMSIAYNPPVGYTHYSPYTGYCQALF